MSYSPVPEYLDLPEPVNYRMGWVNCIFSLARNIPVHDPAALSHWLGVAAESVIEISKDPADAQQPEFCLGLLAYELAKASGQSYVNCTNLITHRMILRHEDNERRAA